MPPPESIRAVSSLPTGRKASRPAVFGWLLFDWAAQPYFTLITTFVFAPYFAARVAATPVEGQALWGYATAAAGLTIALLSPALGAIADASGGRKRWIAAFSSLLIAGSGSLWFATPGFEGAIAIALIGLVAAAVGAEFATIFTNAMMHDLVDEDRLGRLSGTGWAVGYAGGLTSLVLVLGFLVANPASGQTLFGFPPLFGLDPAAFEGDRASGPFTAVWYLIFVLPLFIFTPDVERRLTLKAATWIGLRRLRATLGDVSRNTNVALYFAAHMIYADGLVALFAFGGIYAAGIFGWTSFELGLFGILLTITGTIGALIGGRLDDRYGPKPVILGALVLLIFASAMILSIGPDRIGFFFEVSPAHVGDGLLTSTGERVYLALGALIGAVAGPLQAASRSLMARLAPPNRATEYFGLYAFSGKVTSFAGPFAVGLLTAISGSQRIGISILIIFFAAGAVLLVPVRAPRGLR